MESALIVSRVEKSTAFFTGMLHEAGVRRAVGLGSGGEARRLLRERDFDLVIVNAPLHDETGERLARDIACGNGAQVILVVKSEYADEVSGLCEGDGVLTIAKPVGRAAFWSALTFARAAHNRLSRAQAENARLRQKLEDLRVVGRAKLLLVSRLGMSEEEAHRHLEKQAMDLRATKREIAEGVIKTYADSL
jgi:response regulator NasT